MTVKCALVLYVGEMSLQKYVEQKPVTNKKRAMQNIN